MEEIGIVKHVAGPNAVVVVRRQSACDKCSSGSVCRGTGDAAEIEALNSAGARQGDTVRVMFRPSTYLKGSLVVYGVPALALIAGAVLGKEYVAGSMPQTDPDIVSALCGFGLFAVAVVVVKLVMRRFEGRKDLMPVIEEIMRP